MIVAIIPARGGSKGIPKKNIIDFCGKPLIAWSIEQAIKAKNIDLVYVSSDCDEILSMAISHGAKTIKRPNELSDDFASSESVWIHAINEIKKAKKKELAYIVGMQATSPIRDSLDLDRAITKIKKEHYDSLFSGSSIGDFLIWKGDKKNLSSINYDYKNRKRRQDLEGQFLENGSFYIFKPELIIETQNRLGGKIGIYEMPIWKSFEIDNDQDVKFLKILMKNYLLKKEE